MSARCAGVFVGWRGWVPRAFVALRACVLASPVRYVLGALSNGRTRPYFSPLVRTRVPPARSRVFVKRCFEFPAQTVLASLHYETTAPDLRVARFSREPSLQHRSTKQKNVLALLVVTCGHSPTHHPKMLSIPKISRVLCALRALKQCPPLFVLMPSI